MIFSTTGIIQDVNVDATVNLLKSLQDHLRMRQCKGTCWINSVKRIYVQKCSPHRHKGGEKKKFKITATNLYFTARDLDYPLRVNLAVNIAPQSNFEKTHS